MFRLVSVVPLSEGAWLKEAVSKSGLSADAYAKRIGVSRATLFSWYTRPVLNADVETLFRIIEVSGWDAATLRKEWDEAMAAISDPYRVQIERQAWRTKLMNHIRWMVDTRWRESGDASSSNVEPYSEQRITHEIPYFDLPIAASGWVHVTDNINGGFQCTAAQIKQALFRVKVRGDSMEPRFADGCTIEFKLLCADDGLPDYEKLREGHPYYVQLDDGTGTFKMLKSIEPDHLVLTALNKKYKKPLIAKNSEIVRLGQYEFTLVK